MALKQRATHGAVREAEVVVADTEHVFEGGLELAAGCVVFAEVLIFFSSELLIISGIGIALLAFRYGFMWSIPVLIEWQGPMVVLLNAAILALNAFCDAAIIAIDAAIGLADTFGAKVPYIPPMVWGTLTTAEYVAALKIVSTTCTPYTGVGSVWGLSVLPRVSPEVCPYARMVYPITGGRGTSFVAGFLTTDPNPYTNNCAVTPPHNHEAVCIALASGYAVIEIIVPLLLFCLLLYACGHAVFSLLWSLSSLVVFVVVHAVEHVLKLTEAIARVVKSLAR